MVQIGDFVLDGKGPVYVIAEVAWSHDGSVEKGGVIVDGAAAAGADAINFHITHLPSYMVPFYGAGPGRISGGRDVASVYRYLEQINLGFDQVKELHDRAKAKGLAVSLMVNDEESCRFVGSKLAADMVMIHPSSIFDERFVRQVAGLGIPLVLYTGGMTLGEIERSIGWARSEGNDKLMLQYGFQAYPTPVERNDLRKIPKLKQLFGLPVSFADHTDGDDPMAIHLPALAVALGADIVEKHMTHDRAVKGEDFEAALDPTSFPVFVKALRGAEAALGRGAYGPLSEAEVKYRGVVRKRAVAARALAAGETLDASMIAYKRADSGLYPEEIVPLAGHVTLASALEENAPIDWRSLAAATAPAT